MANGAIIKKKKPKKSELFLKLGRLRKVLSHLRPSEISVNRLGFQCWQKNKIKQNEKLHDLACLPYVLLLDDFLAPFPSYVGQPDMTAPTQVTD